jgi:hypothetical protein
MQLLFIFTVWAILTFVGAHRPGVAAQWGRKMGRAYWGKQV